MSFVLQYKCNIEILLSPDHIKMFFNSLHAGQFLMLCHLLIFFKIKFFRKTIGVSNGLTD